MITSNNEQNIQKKKRFKKKTSPQSKLNIIPIGGCNEFGMNMTAYESEKKFIIIDAGALFPEDKLLGVSSIIPQFKKIFSKLGNLLAYVITHGHEDHIGALPIIYKSFPAPIYATPWTCELIKKKFIKFNIELKNLNLIRCKESILCGPFKIEYIHVNHSIPDAAALLIKSKAGIVFHSGDFKIDKNPANKEKIDLNYLKKLGNQGIDILLTDSTNAHKEGFTPSEHDIVKPLENLISKAKGRVFITSFASNFWRMKTIFNICEKLNKKLIVDGRSFRDSLEIAKKLGRLKNTEKTIVEPFNVKKVPQDQQVVVVSGSQGEELASLARISRQEHRHFKINNKDIVIFSARPIPGNEKSIFSVVEGLKRQGAEIINSDAKHHIHVSGHAHSKDLILLASHLRPRYYIPVHGSYNFLFNNYSAVKNAIKNINAIIIGNSEILELSRQKCHKKNFHFETDKLFIDQDSHRVLNEKTLKRRLDIGEFGLVVLSGLFSLKTKKWQNGPEIELVGIESLAPATEKKHLNKISLALKEKTKKTLSSKPKTRAEIENICTIELRKILKDIYKKNICVISKIICI